MNQAELLKSNLKTKNFKPEDFFVSKIAESKKIDNTTDNVAILSCLVLIANKIQEVRELLDFPITISSAYRCRELNRLVGSKDNSQHIQGQAVDFVCPKFGSPEKIVKFLKENKVEVDQCLIEKSWVHLSFTHNKNRNQFGKYIDGKFSIIE